MFRKIFITVFVIQSFFVASAWSAGSSSAMLNQVANSQMEILHGVNSVSNMQDECELACSGSICADVICISVHFSGNHLATFLNVFEFVAMTEVSEANITKTDLLPFLNFPPETPPPNI